MTIHNVEIADKFNRVANLLEIQGDNPFRIRAYRNAARIIANLSKNIADMVSEGEPLHELPGIGKDLAEKITLLVKTGEFPLLKRIESRLPPLLNELMSIEGLGPKRIALIYKKLKIKNVNSLKDAISKGELRKLHGFGEKIEQKILQGLDHIGEHNKRFKLRDVMPIVASLSKYLEMSKDLKTLTCTGSFRRRKETVGDLDMLAIAKSKENDIIDRFIHYDEVEEVLSKGTTRASIRLHAGINVDLRVVPAESYGAALLYFTGSKPHNIAIRKLALKKKLKVNEYGVFKGNKQIAGATEKEVYEQVGLPYIEPELREDQGEIEEARKGILPKLIQLKDIRGDLHCHTNATDGTASLEAMAKAAEFYGYEYLAITDHSKHLAFTGGLDKKALFAQIKRIDKLNAKLKKIVILKSIEVDILEDGSLDLPDDVLKELDLTVCSIHANFNLSQEKQTERIIRAMDNPYCTIIGHLTGRLIHRRGPYPLNVEKIMLAAKDRACALELNAQPSRLDLHEVYCKMAKTIGVNIAISTDAHSTSQLDFMKFGIYQARRGWLTKNDVINTLSLNALKKKLRQ